MRCVCRGGHPCGDASSQSAKRRTGWSAPRKTPAGSGELAVTTPIIEPMNARNSEKKRGTGSFARHVVPGVNGHEQADASHQQSANIHANHPAAAGNESRHPAASVVRNAKRRLHADRARTLPPESDRHTSPRQTRWRLHCGHGLQQGCHGTTDKWQRQQEQQGHACVEEGRRDCGGQPQTKTACRQT